jgi:hypothetical protein
MSDELPAAGTITPADADRLMRPRSRTASVTIAAVAGLVALCTGTLGSLAAGFGVSTNCTDDFDCTKSTCGPCQTSDAWLIAGAVGQGILFLAAIVLLVMAARRATTTRMAVGIAVLALSPLWWLVSTLVANSSY